MAELPKFVWGRMNRPPGAPDEHPDADLLNAFCEGALKPLEREQILAHLALCAECRDVVALITPAEGPPRPVAQPRRAWLSFPILRWAAIAGTVAVLLAVALLHRPEAPRPLLHSDAEAPSAVSKEVSAPPTPARERADQSGTKAQPKEPAVASGATTRQARSAESKPEAELQQAPSRTDASRESKTPPVATRPGYQDFDSSTAKEKLEQRSLDEQSKARSSASQDRVVHLPNPQAPHGPAAPSQQQIVVESPPQQIPGSGSDQQKRQPPPVSSTRRYGEQVTVAGAAPEVQTDKPSAVGGPVTGGPVSANANSVSPRGSESNVARHVPDASASAAAQRKSAMKPATKAQGGAVDSFGVAGGLVNQPATWRSTANVHWSISPEGTLLRSIGATPPQLVTVGKDVAFRSVASVGFDVWAGGAHGVLYHSSDAGTTWNLVPFPATQDIVSIQFKSAREGLITTADGRQYVTHEGGQTWKAVEER